jgi:hypothetical protein
MKIVKEHISEGLKPVKIKMNPKDLKVGDTVFVEELNYEPFNKEVLIYSIRNLGPITEYWFNDGNHPDYGFPVNYPLRTSRDKFYKIS